jgi:cell division protein FtsB
LINALRHKEDKLMKTMLSFSSLIVCLITLFLLVPIAAAQETEAAEDQEASQEDKIAAEKEMLEAKIAELEEKPVEYFGSPKNKRTRVGFYKYRLEMLLEDPDKYFSEPEEYEGNIKSPE